MNSKRLSVLALVFAFAVFISGCGGGSSAPSVSVTASSATVDGADTITLTATVKHDKNSAGVNWSASAGTLSGETTTGATLTAPAAAAASQTITVTATSIADSSKTGTVTITVPAAPKVTTTEANLASSVGSSYSVTLAGSGGITPYKWTLASGALPPCLAMTSAGAITGTVTASCAGTYTPTFTLTDSGTPTALTASAQLNIVIAAAPAISFSGTVPSTGPYNVAYTGSVTATGGAGTLTYALATGSSLPAGVTLNAATGAIHGTPTAVGTFTFAIVASDAFGDTATSSSYSITVSYPALSVVTSSLPIGYVGSAYSTTALTATGGSGVSSNYSWALGAGSSLPVGLSLSPAGVLSGTPTGTAGTNNVTVVVSDSVSSFTANAVLALQIKAGVTITAQTLPTGYVGTAYPSTQLAATGGSGTYSTWALASGSSLPAGLSLSTAGVISGTPSGSTGTIDFTVRVTDSASNTATASFSIIVKAGITITTGTSLPDGYPGDAYPSTTLAATGGSGSYTNWSVISGSLPAGLNLSTDGTLSGTPTTAGNGSFTVKVTDSASNTATATFTLTVESALTVTSTALASAAVNNSYSQKLAASGGSGGYTWSVSSGAANTLATYNLSLAADGTVSGTPTTTGSAVFTAVVTDSAGHTASQALTITVSSLVVNTGTLNYGVIGSSYSQTLSASGGTAPYTWSVTAGANNLSALGLSLTSAGVLTSSGVTLTTTGSAAFTVQVKDANNITATANYTVYVYAALSFVTTSLPSAIYNDSYSATIVATGGSGSYTWSVNSASIPTTGATTSISSGGGLTASNTGGSTLTLGGTPTSYGTITLNVQVADAQTGFVNPKTFTVAVNSLTVSIDPNDVPQGMVGMPYTFSNVNVQNGTQPFTIAYSNAPDGLAGNASNQLVGTPSATGSTTVTVTVTDSSTPTNQVGTATFSLPVVAQTTGTDDSALSGQYACNLERTWDSGVTGGNGTSTLYHGGLVFAFTASGGGSISGGEVDSNSPISGHTLTSSITGSYAIGADHRGYINIGSGSLLLSVAASNISSGVFTELSIAEMDDAGSSPSGQFGSGHCYRQVTSALSGIRPSGGYVFAVHGEDSNGSPEAVVGQVTFSGSTANGTQDSVDGTSVSNADTFSNTTGTTDSFGRLLISHSGTGEMVVYLTNNAKGDGLMMTVPDHSGTSNADFLIGQTRAQSATNIAATHPLNGKAILYVSGPVSVSGSTPSYKTFAAQVTGSTSNNKITINSIVKNNAGTYSIDTDNMYGQSVSYTTDASTGRTTLTGATGDYLYLYDTNSAVVLFSDTGTGGGTNAQIGWLDPQTVSGSWSLSSIATSVAMRKLPNEDPNSNSSTGVLTVGSNGTISGFAQDSGSMLWADWDEAISGSPSVTGTGALSLNATDGASYGLFDINLTSGGSTQNVSECYAISVDTATTSTAKARMVCVDLDSNHPALTLIQE